MITSRPQQPSKRGTVGVPALALRAWRGGKPRSGVMHYDSPDHRVLPHVIKFSGGRSSGLMLLTLLENELLSAPRGDVVLFTNTSAEHPATYDFVRKMKRATEKYGIPFFIAEWQTIETVAGGEWRRRPTYRLANDRPWAKDNPYGYSFRGEVFEEAVAWGGMLPSVHTRLCTTLMKMFVTREFLADWFAARPELPEQGHRGKASQSDAETHFRIHRMNRGTMTFAEASVRWGVLTERSTSRPRQRFSDYTRAPLPSEVNPSQQHCILGDRCQLFGDTAAPYLTFLGFRHGEDARFVRMVQRNHGQQTPGHDTQPPGEYSYAPLHNMGIGQERVLKFWDQQPRSIRPYLPRDMNLSNCVYCFLKGPHAIAQISRAKKTFEQSLPKCLRTECRKRNTPNSLSWWARFEDTHKRRSRKNTADGQRHGSFGMLGLKGVSYGSLRDHAQQKGKRSRVSLNLASHNPTLNCECTD